MENENTSAGETAAPAQPPEVNPGGERARLSEPARSAAEPASRLAEPAPRRERGRILLICSLIFLVAAGCRLLSWHDNRYEARKVQTAVTEGYKHTGRLLQSGGIPAFFSAGSPLSDPNHLGHPPGYSILIAIVFGAFGESDAALQIIQLLADSLAAVVVFLIALALFKRPVATVSGLLVAFAPQFTYNSVLLLPDSISVLPILLAILFFIRAYRRPRLAAFIIAGALVGISCWLRANALLLAPFIAASAPLLFKPGRRLRPALAILGGWVLIIAPLTLRNYIVYDHFIPVSLGAGQTLLEGISDYDEKKSLGIPNTDMGLMKWEAEYYGRPDYYGTLFNPDGVKRERLRLAQGFAVIRSHPLWFFGVMARRAGSMLRLERVRLISADPPVTHSLNETNELAPVWAITPQELLSAGTIESKGVRISLSSDGRSLNLSGDESKNQLVSAPFSIEAQTDYALKLPVKVEQGRIMLSVEGANDHYTYASVIAEAEDWKSPAEQPLNVLEAPFVSRMGGGGDQSARIVIANAGAKGVTPVLHIGQPELYRLGAASFTWTRPLRWVIRLIQKLFVTAVMLPLTLTGLVLLVRARKFAALVFLLMVPAYYLCVQSALHTEYRYVLAIHYFLFIVAAAALARAGSRLRRLLRRLPRLRYAASAEPASAEPAP